MTARMSFFVTRPARPLPLKPVSSIPCSAAIFRTSGDDFVRSRSSNEPGVDGAVTSAGLGGAGLGARGAGVAPCVADGAAVVPSPAGTGAGGNSAPVLASGLWPPAAAATAASVSKRATIVCTGTVCPSCTSISTSTPAEGAGISASTLSVEISNIGSSRLTDSPTFLSQRDRVPSAMDSPI